MSKHTWIHAADALPADLLTKAGYGFHLGALPCFGQVFGVDQLRPDCLPVVGAQVFARHGLSGVAFDQNRQLWGAWPVAIGDVLKVAHGSVRPIRKLSSVLNRQGSEVGNEFHQQITPRGVALVNTMRCNFFC